MSITLKMKKRVEFDSYAEARAWGKANIPKYKDWYVTQDYDSLKWILINHCNPNPMFYDEDTNLVTKYGWRESNKDAARWKIALAFAAPDGKPLEQPDGSSLPFGFVPMPFSLI